MKRVDDEQCPYWVGSIRHQLDAVSTKCRIVGARSGVVDLEFPNLKKVEQAGDGSS